MAFPLIVFEGPDMCGKSTHVDSVIKMLDEKGFKFKYVKFPVYDGYMGEEILDHLKNFDVFKGSLTEAIEDLTYHAANLWVNKIAHMNSIKQDGYCGAIVDRFDLSQFIYDAAWLPIFKKINNSYIFCAKSEKEIKRILRKFFDKAVERALTTHNLYEKSGYDIWYVLFKSSSYVKYMATLDSSRRYDKYDENDYYQNRISNIFDLITNNPELSVKFALSKDLYDRELSEKKIEKYVKARKSNNILFECLYNSSSFEIFRNKANSKRICVIDTDEMYDELHESDFEKSNTIEDLVSKHRISVTYQIDRKIVQGIIDSLGLGGNK